MTLSYNRETLDAMREARNIMSGKVPAKTYHSIAEMHADIDAMDDEDGDARN